MSERRCKRRRPQRDGFRPSDMLAAFFIAGVGFVVLAVAVGFLAHFIEIEDARWLVLHAVFVGGVSQFVLGAAQFFAGAYLATGPPRRGFVRAQFVLWNMGTLVLLASSQASNDLLSSTAALLLAAGLAVFFYSLVELQNESLQQFPWATRWYRAAVGFLIIGLGVGAVLASGSASDQAGELLQAHMTLNLIGWFGTAIVGTLHTFFPSLTGTALPWANLQKATFFSWVLGVALLASGFAVSLSYMILSGLALLVIAGLLMTANIAGSYSATSGARPLTAKLVAAGQVCLVPGLVVVAVGLIANNYTLTGEYRSGAAVLLIQGWIGLTVAGSLIHLLRVLGRVRNLAATERDISPPFSTALAPALVGATLVTAIAYLAGNEELARAVSAVALVAFLLLAITVVRLALVVARVASLKL